MKKCTIAVVALCVSAVLFGDASAFAASSSQPKNHILFLGNSFVRGVHRPLKLMLKAAGINARINSRSPAVWTLGRHAQSDRTSRVLESQPWSYVFLQEQSDGIDAQRFVDARLLHARIHDAGARTVFFMTWRDRDASAADYLTLKGVPGGDVGYVPIAFELDASIAPIGWAIRNGLVGGLPIDLWKRDGHHLNPRGKFLAACVCYAAITGESPVGLPAPKGLTEFEIAYLQGLADLTVLSDPAQWNLDVP